MPRIVLLDRQLAIDPVADMGGGEGRQGGLHSPGAKVSESARLPEIPRNTSAWRPFYKMAAVSVS